MTSENLNFPLDASQYELQYIIGHGATSDVYVAKCRANNKTLSIKLINLEAYPLEIEFLRQEVAFWSSTQLPQVVRYYGSFVSGPLLYILMEYMAGGSVSDIIRYSFPKGFKNEKIIATILYAILKALAYIHSHDELHRDVKPGNALIGEDGQVKIADFGVAATLNENGQRKNARYTVIGTPCYMAPEILQEETGYTQKADIWSFGITAIELATGQAPYSNLQPLAVVQKILKAPPPILTPKSGEYSPEFCQVIKACLNHDPTKRPTADDLLQMPFFSLAQPPEYLKDVLISKIPTLEERYATIQAKGIQYAIDHDKENNQQNQAFQFDFGDDQNSNNNTSSQQQQLIQLPVEPKSDTKANEKKSQENNKPVNGNFPLNNFGLNVVDFTTDKTNNNNNLSSIDNSKLNSNTNNDINVPTTNSNNNDQKVNDSEQNQASDSQSPNRSEERIKKGRFNLTKKPSRYLSNDDNLKLQSNSSSNSNINSGHSSEVLVQSDDQPKKRLRPNLNYSLQSQSLPPNANPLNSSNRLGSNNNDPENRFVNNHANRGSPASPNFKIDRGNAVNSPAKVNQNPIQNQTVQDQSKSQNTIDDGDINNEDLFQIMQKLAIKTEKLTEETHAIKSEIQELFNILQSLPKPKNA